MNRADIVKDILTPLLNELDERSRHMIELRFGLTTYARTLEEIADEFGLARERIRQLLRKTLEHLSEEAKPLLFSAIVQEAADLRAALIEEHGAVGPELLPSRYDEPWRDLALGVCGVSTESWIRIVVRDRSETVS